MRISIDTKLQDSHAHKAGVMRVHGRLITCSRLTSRATVLTDTLSGERFAIRLENTWNRDTSRIISTFDRLQCRGLIEAHDQGNSVLRN